MSLRNLLDNAAKYTPAGGEVRLVAQVFSRHLAIQVSDNGPGIASEDQERVFERFFTRDERRRGVGLGLALVRELIVRNGGELSLQSAPGVGTTFEILFPLERENTWL